MIRERTRKAERSRQENADSLKWWYRGKWGPSNGQSCSRFQEPLNWVCIVFSVFFGFTEEAGWRNPGQESERLFLCKFVG